MFNFSVSATWFLFALCFVVWSNTVVYALCADISTQELEEEEEENFWDDFPHREPFYPCVLCSLIVVVLTLEYFLCTKSQRGFADSSVCCCCYVTIDVCAVAFRCPLLIYLKDFGVPHL